MFEKALAVNRNFNCPPFALTTLCMVPCYVGIFLADYFRGSCSTYVIIIVDRSLLNDANIPRYFECRVILM